MKKNKRLELRLTEEEYKQICLMAEVHRQKKSEYILDALFSKEIIRIDGMDEVYRELRRVGSNVNQIATLAHMGKIHSVYLHETQKSLAGVWDELHNIQVVLNKLRSGKKSG